MPGETPTPAEVIYLSGQHKNLYRTTYTDIVLEELGFNRKQVLFLDSEDELQKVMSKMQPNQIHLIITSTKLDRGTGLRAIETLKNTDGWKSIPTVVLTSSSSPEIRKRAQDAGADAFLSITQSIDEHLQILNELLEGNKE